MFLSRRQKNTLSANLITEMTSSNSMVTMKKTFLIMLHLIMESTTLQPHVLLVIHKSLTKVHRKVKPINHPCKIIIFPRLPMILYLQEKKIMSLTTTMNLVKKVLLMTIVKMCYNHLWHKMKVSFLWIVTTM